MQVPTVVFDMTWIDLQARSDCLAFYPFPNDNILDWSKLKAFQDDKINVNQKLKFDFGRIENIVRKEENAGYQHFLLFPQCFQTGLFIRVVKNWDCVVKG